VYPEPFCTRDLNAIDPQQTVIFVGRVTKAEGGLRDLQEQLNKAASGGGQMPMGLAGVIPVEPGAGVEATRNWLLRKYGRRLDESQRSRLLNATSTEALHQIAGSFALVGRPVEFEVLENLVGVLPDRIEIFTGMGSGDCGIDFVKGETYLVETFRRSNGEWHSWLCSSRVSRLEFAAEDLRTLRAWKQGNPLASRVYGVVTDWTTRQNKHPRRYPPADGVGITLSSQNAGFRTVTDKDGRFRFENLEHAIYRLELDQPGWGLTDMTEASQPIDLSSGGCADLYVTIEENQGSIKGRVLPHPGEELPQFLWIEAIPRDPRNPQPFDATAKAPGGEFEIDQIEPGEYYVSINVKNPPSGPHHRSAKYGRIWPYGPTYYPGVTDPANAAWFRVDRGQTITLSDWTLPPRLQERRMTGVARLPNGSTAPGVTIKLRRPGVEEVAEQTGPTGADGEFVVWPLETLDYEVEAVAYNRETGKVVRAKLRISADERGPLVVQLEPSDE
jgi:hypothetical protein